MSPTQTPAALGYRMPAEWEPHEATWLERNLLEGASGVALGLLVILVSSFVVVDSGHVGVVTVFGNVEKDPLYNGLHLVMPYKDVIQMDTRVQKHEAKYDAASVDIQAVHAVMALNFRLIGEKAPEVYRTVGLRYEQSIIDPAAAEVLKAQTAIHAANDILQQRPKIKSDVQDGLTKWLAKYGIQVTEVSIKDIRFDKDFELARKIEEVILWKPQGGALEGTPNKFVFSKGGR